MLILVYILFQDENNYISDEKSNGSGRPKIDGSDRIFISGLSLSCWLYPSVKNCYLPKMGRKKLTKTSDKIQSSHCLWRHNNPLPDIVNRSTMFSSFCQLDEQLTRATENCYVNQNQNSYLLTVCSYLYSCLFLYI